MCKMDNEQKRQELKLEQKVSEVGYDILITANIYNYDPVSFAEKILQFIKEKTKQVE